MPWHVYGAQVEGAAWPSRTRCSLLCNPRLSCPPLLFTSDTLRHAAEGPVIPWCPASLTMGSWVSDMLTGACCLLSGVGMGRVQGEHCCASFRLSPPSLSPLLCGWWRDSASSEASRQQPLSTQHPIIAPCSPCPAGMLLLDLSSRTHLCWQPSML